MSSGKDQGSDGGHGGYVHDAERHEDDEEQLAAAHAVHAVEEAYAHRAASSVPPPCQHEGHRTTALSQAHVVHRGQLVGAGRHEHGAASTTPIHRHPI